jgi:hypothetical protein
LLIFKERLASRSDRHQAGGNAKPAVLPGTSGENSEEQQL